jgi:bacteriorhodopsin
MTLFLRGNDALNVNPPYGPDETLSLAGSDWLWAVMAVHLLAFVSDNTTLFDYDSSLTSNVDILVTFVARAPGFLLHHPRE